MNLSIVVPVYNSELTLPSLVERVQAILEKIAQNSEIFFVDDGSSDDSWLTIQKLAEKYDNITGIRLMRNYGQHNALLCGIEHCSYDFIVTMDDDLQHPPEEIPKLLAKLEEGYDVVYGNALRQPHGILRAVASKTLKGVLSLVMGRRIARKVSAFRAFRREVVRAFSGYRGPYVSIDVLLSWGTTKFSAVGVRHVPRKTGQSNYRFLGLIGHAIDMLTGFSSFPLMVAGFVGAIVTVFGVCLLVYVFVMYWIHGGAVPGFTFLASTISIFSGTQLVCLGVIGAYLGRMHYRSMGRPTSVIREFTGKDRLRSD